MKDACDHSKKAKKRDVHGGVPADDSVSTNPIIGE